MISLTKDQILALPAGHEIDDLVQEQVYGFEGACEDGSWYVIPSKPFSTDKVLARNLLQDLLMREADRFIVNKLPNGNWRARFDCRHENRKARRRVLGVHEAVAETMPLAVCRAALLSFAPASTPIKPKESSETV